MMAQYRFGKGNWHENKAISHSEENLARGDPLSTEAITTQSKLPSIRGAQGKTKISLDKGDDVSNVLN